MNKYKIISIVGDKNYFEGSELRTFDDLESAQKYFNNLNLNQEMTIEWNSSNPTTRRKFIDTDTFFEYDLVEFDTDDDNRHIVLHYKAQRFRYLHPDLD